jgi:hypothetical protein
LSRLLVAFLIFALPVLSFAEEKKAAPKKKPAAGQQAKKGQAKKAQAKKPPEQDWGRFNATSKRDLDTAERKKSEKAAKK